MAPVPTDDVKFPVNGMETIMGRRHLFRIVRTVTDPATGRTWPVPAGADDGPSELEQLVARLGSDTEPLTVDELATLELLARDAFDEADSGDPDLELMEALAGHIEAALAEQATHAQAQADREEAAQQLRDRVQPPAAEEDPAEEDPAEATVEDEDPAEAATEEEPAEEPEPVVAAAEQPRRPTLAELNRARRPQTRRVPDTPQVPRASLTASAAGDVPGMSAGASIETLDQLARAFAEKAHALMASGMRVGGKVPVARLDLQFPDERTMSHDPRVSDQRIDTVVASLGQIDTVVAAGGLCAPVAAAYDLQSVTIESRPIRDGATVRFGADRGGIRFITPPTLADLAGSVGVWTEENDREAADPDGNPDPATKPITRVTCGEEVEVVVDAITKRLLVGNFSRRTFPEQFARWWQLAGAAHSRLAETVLWNSMVAASTSITVPGLLGASRDLLAAVDLIVAGERSRHRMADTQVIRVVLPSWTRQVMRTDLARQMPGDSTTSVTDAQLDQHFTDRHVAVTYSPDADQVFDAQPAGAVVPFPNELEFLAYPEGSFTFLDGGELNFGVDITSPAYQDVNDVGAFMETFEAVAFRGVTSLHVTVPIDPNGLTAGVLIVDDVPAGS